MVIEDLLPIVLGGGGFLVATAQALSSWRNGVEQREAKAIANIVQVQVSETARADRAEKRLAEALDNGYNWRAYAGSLEYELESHGFKPKTASPKMQGRVAPQPDSPVAGPGNHG